MVAGPSVIHRGCRERNMATAVATQGLAEIASTMENQANVHSAVHRGFEMAEMLHHLSVILLLIALVLFIYSMDTAVAISVSTLVVLYLVAQLKQTNYRYSSWSRL